MRGKVIHRTLLITALIFVLLLTQKSGKSWSRSLTYNPAGDPAVPKLTNSMSAFTEMLSVDYKITNFLKKHKITGASVAIVKDDHLVYAKGFGYANKETGEIVQPTNLFRIASVSKLVTAVAIMKLIEENHFKIDDKVFGEDGILNDPMFLNIKDKRVKNITVHQLLNHTAGFNKRRGGDPMFKSQMISNILNLSGPVETKDIIKYVLSRPLGYVPGTHYSYSNVGYAILGIVIEKITHLKYEEYVTSQILHPLGIFDMRIGKTYIDRSMPNEVKYYKQNECIVAESDSSEDDMASFPDKKIEVLSSAGGWIASASSLMKLVSAIDGYKERKDILSEETINQMTQRYSSESRSLGWAYTDRKDNWYRTGTLSGSSALVVRQNNGICWSILLNSTPYRKKYINLEMFTMMNSAMQNISSWPNVDLFSCYQFEPLKPIVVNKIGN